MQLTGLFIYPIKGLGGISLKESLVTSRGLSYDRRWMLVDEEGVFISQREFPLLSLVKVQLEEDYLIVDAPHLDMESLHVPLRQAHFSGSREVQVWDDFCEAFFVGPEVDAWFSRVVGNPCRLVYMPDTSHRQIDERYGKPGEPVSFADGYPCLIIGEASLNDLNSRLAQPITMNRFRPNLVFSGDEPFVEDTWQAFRIGDTAFRAVKPCARCEVTTIDPLTGRRGKEPLATLAQFRRQGHKVLFGMNCIPELADGAMVRVGDVVTVE